MRRRVVIVGGGATGVAAFAALVRHRVAARVDIVDPLPVGSGRAFATTRPALLCNTSVGIMSLVAGAPDDFLDHLLARGVPADRDAFVPRFHFSRYVRDRYLAYRVLHRRGGGAGGHVRGRASFVRRVPGGGYEVVLDDGRRLDATDVLLCQGYGDPVVPGTLRPHLGADRLFIGPCPEGALLTAMPGPASRVLVLGTRLSAIDAGLLLCGAGHRVVMASPSGELPAVRTRTGSRPGPPLTPDLAALDFSGPRFERQLVALVARAASTVSGRRLRDQVATPVRVPVPVPDDPVERLRREIRLAEEGRTDWQDILCATVDAANQVLPALDAPTRAAALRRCAPLLRYLGAIPLGTARTLLRHVEAGRLTIRRGVPVEIAPGPRRWRAVWSGEAAERYDAVVTAAGYGDPPLHVSGDHLHLTGAGCRHPGAAPGIGEDVRVRFPGSPVPERIWAVGVTSSSRVPSINAVYPMVQQADAVARACRDHPAPEAAPTRRAASCAARAKAPTAPVSSPVRPTGP
ncbi:FAD/NAD(P)-binding protein [Streptomyces sp. CB03234]|uniref:FAD/NAD(P)-binding protein n=1 Tax=Streptomyces sp. (strain CB03234) TaxID=1703937 RepID=UPI00093DECC4|nr:FAD/NAD(P)-binding protein [Streptomyces sp. CB03234]